MTCPHTETTAVLAAFGEAPPDFEAHISECSSCRRTVAEHLQTLGSLDLASPAAGRPQEGRWNRYAAAFLLAASILLALQFTPHHSSSVPTAPTQTITLDALPFDAPLDDELESLEMELALFTLEET